MTRSPTSVEMNAMRRVTTCPGEFWRDDFPRTVLNECVLRGWMEEDDHGHIWMTHSGAQMFEARR